MPKLKPNDAAAQAAADRFLDAIMGVVETHAGGPQDIDWRAIRASVAPVLEQVRADEREACLDVMRDFDRTGREWVAGSLWSNIFRDAIARIEARGLAVIEMHGVTTRDQARNLARHVERRRAVGKGPDPLSANGFSPDEIAANKADRR